MQNNHENSTISKTDLRTSTPRNGAKPVYSIESATISGDTVKVDYLLNAEWKDTEISFSKLKQFALDMSMNTWCFDYCDGEVKQDEGAHDIDTFMADNLEEVVKYFLESIHNPFTGIIESLDRLLATSGKGGLLCA